MTSLLLLVALAVIVLILKRFHEQRQLQHLRDNPPPKVLFEVRLPGGVDDSNKRMEKFYRKIPKLTTTDAKMRKAGLGTIEAVYLAEVPLGRDTAELRFLMMCAPEQVQVLKRTLKQTFSSLAEITTPSDDPLAEMVEALTPPKAAEPGGPTPLPAPPDTE